MKKPIKRNLSPYTVARITDDIKAGHLLDRKICEKFNISLSTFRRIKAHYVINHSFLTVPVHLGSKKEAYYPDESELLSCPYYNPLDLRGAELEILNKLVS